MNACYSDAAAKRWCVAADAPTPAIGEIPNGWCCDDASTDEKCTNGDNYKCTLNNKGQMAKQLWSTYWPGITPQLCGGDGYSSHSLRATEDLQLMKTPNLVTYERVTTAANVEACWFSITADTDRWKPGSEIAVYLNSTTAATMYIYQGNDRRNLSAVI